MFRILIIATVLFGVVLSVHAIPVGLDAFSEDDTIIDFNNIVSGIAITNQYAEYGVQFYGAPFQGDPFPDTSINGTMSAANHLPINNPVFAYFDNIQNQVGMLFGTTIGVDSVVEIRAYLGNTQVDFQTFISTDANTIPGGNLASVFGGIYVADGFDRIEISSLADVAAFQIDNFRFSSSNSSAPVPEPSTIMLLGCGLILVGWKAKKRNMT
jgi:hypothetical protein